MNDSPSSGDERRTNSRNVVYLKKLRMLVSPEISLCLTSESRFTLKGTGL